MAKIWTPRCLTLLGSITKFTHILLSLPTPNKLCEDEIDGLLKNFLWGDKPPKYRADILESKQIEGGLSYPKLSTFNDALNYLGLGEYTQVP